MGLKLWPDNSATVAYFGARSRKSASKDAIDPSKPAAPLGLSSVNNSRTVRRKALKPKGRKGITSYGKRMVRSMVCLLERNFDRRQLSFGTATLPALSEEELHKVQANWAKVVNRFFEEMARHFNRRGHRFDYVHCSEIQPKRWFRDGVVGLHIHWLCVGRSHPWGEWTIAPGEVAAIWARVLARVLGYEPDTTAATRIEVPKKSVKRELAKYLSKGCAVIQKIIEAGQGDRLPNAWWGGRTELKRDVHDNTFLFDDEVAKAVQFCLDELRESGICGFNHIFRALQEGELWVATAIHFRCDYSVAVSYLRNLEQSYSSE